MKPEWYSDKRSSCSWCCAGLWRWEVLLLGHGLHFLWRMLVLNNQEDQSLLHVATAKRQEQCRGGDLAEYVWRAQPCEGETSSEQSEWTRNELMKPSCSGFLLYAEFIDFWRLIMFEQLDIHSYRILNHFWVTEVKCLEPMDAQSYEFWVAKAGEKSHHPNFAQRLERIFSVIGFCTRKNRRSEKKLTIFCRKHLDTRKKTQNTLVHQQNLAQVMQHTLSAIAYCHSKAVIHKATQLQTMLTKCEQYVCRHLQNPMLSELDQIT